MKVVNVPGGYDAAAIEGKIGVIANALGKQPQGETLRQLLQAEFAKIPSQPLNKRVLFYPQPRRLRCAGCRSANGGGRRHQTGRVAKRHAGF